MSPRAVLSGAGAGSSSGSQGTQVPAEGEAQPPPGQSLHFPLRGLTPWPVCGAGGELSGAGQGALVPSPVVAGRGVLETLGTGLGEKTSKERSGVPVAFPTTV